MMVLDDFVLYDLFDLCGLDEIRRDIEELGRVGSGEGAVEALMCIVKKVDRCTREQVAEAQRMGDAGIDEMMVESFNVYLRVRMWVEEALKKIGGESAFEAQSNLYFEDMGNLTQDIEGLGRVGSGESVVEELIRRLDDGNLFIRCMYKWLAEDGTTNEQLIGSPFSSFESDNNRMRQSIAEALGGLGGVRAADVLIDLLWGGPFLVKFAAKEALEKIGDKRAVELLNKTDIRFYHADELLEEALNDKDEFVSGYAALALGKLSGKRKVEALIRLLDHDHDFVRGCAVRALETVGGARAVEVLKEAFGGMDKPLMCDKSAVKVLIEVLDDEDEFVRMYAERAIVNLCGERAIEELDKKLIRDMGGTAGWLIGEIQTKQEENQRTEREKDFHHFLRHHLHNNL